MIEERIGYRYAKSIFDLAKEKGITEPVYSDMETLSATCRGSKELQNFLASPIIPKDAKQKALNRIFAGLQSSELTPLLIATILRKGREMYLAGIADSYIKIYDQNNGIERGEIISSEVLSEQEVANIQKSVEAKVGKKFVFVQKVNPDLIGGFIVRVGDKLFDGSVASALRQLSHTFEDKSFVRMI